MRATLACALIVGALAWGRRTSTPVAQPDVALTGAGKV